MNRAFRLTGVAAALGMLLLAEGCGQTENDGAGIQTAAKKAAGSATPLRTVSAKDVPHAVKLTTSLGDIVVELNHELAPLTVANFLNYVAEGYYDGTIFHDIQDGFIAVGGGYTANLEEKSTNVPIRNEADNGLSNLRGTIAMARAPNIVDSSTSQFFFNLADNESLDHAGREPAEYGYCVFGKVIDGMDIVASVAKKPTEARDGFEHLPLQTVLIKKATRLR